MDEYDIQRCGTKLRIVSLVPLETLNVSDMEEYDTCKTDIILEPGIKYINAGSGNNQPPPMMTLHVHHTLSTASMFCSTQQATQLESQSPQYPLHTPPSWSSSPLSSATGHITHNVGPPPYTYHNNPSITADTAAK